MKIFKFVGATVAMAAITAIATEGFAGWGDLGKAAAGVAVKKAIDATVNTQEKSAGRNPPKESERQQRDETPKGADVDLLNVEFDELMRKAEGGDTEAMCEVGRRYRNGMGVEKNDKLASSWTQKAAAQKSERAVGLCLEFGYGVKTNIQDAVKWYRKSAERGNANAMLRIGLCYAYGEVVAKDMAKAVRWYCKSAEKGCSSAMRILGSCYKYGKGVDKDLAKAAKCYREAAGKGDVDAMRLLGSCYKYGEGVDKDLAKAAKWYREAAGKGDLDAMDSLGSFYQLGDGVEKDKAEAVKWFRKSAEGGNASGMYSLGLCYEFGDGIEKNMEDAAKWYRKSAEEECESAMYRLGLCYGKGEGVEKSPTEAVKWFKKAAELGDEDAKKQMQQPNPGVFEKEEKTTVASAESAKKNMKERLTDPKTTYSAAWMMWDEYKELSDEDRKDFVTAAEKRAAEAQNSTIVFEGFYAGMPLIDFIAISEQKKVFQKWEKMFSGSSRWHYAEISDAKDLVSRYVITMMMFEGRDWGKLIDCEDDSEVLDQFVHQYVLKKTGKASPLTTLGKAKLEGPDAYDRWWKTYKSTKYGMSVAWCKDKSFLRLMKLGDD